MKRILLLLAVLTGAFAGLLLYERLFVEQSFGPAAMVSIALVVGACALLLLSFLVYDTRFREAIVRVWLVIISVAVSYLALDLIAGFLLIKPLSPALVLDPYRHHALVPSSQSRIEEREFSYVMRVNNLGLRGVDVPVQKPADTYRILMLGDSFTEGKGVTDSETFSVLLEKVLRQETTGCGGKTVQVLNAGVDSYAPILSFIQLQRDLGALQPDLVVLNLDVSDLVQEQAYRRLATFAANGDPLTVPGVSQGGVTLTERIRSWVNRRLFFTRALLVYVDKAFRYTDLKRPDVLSEASREITDYTLTSDSIPRDKQWLDIFDSIDRIRDYAARRGAGFILTIYPWPHEYSDSAWIPGRYTFIPRGAVVAYDRRRSTITALAERNHVELLDLFPAFRAYHGGKALRLRHALDSCGPRGRRGGVCGRAGAPVHGSMVWRAICALTTRRQTRSVYPKSASSIAKCVPSCIQPGCCVPPQVSK